MLDIDDRPRASHPASPAPAVSDRPPGRLASRLGDLIDGVRTTGTDADRPEGHDVDCQRNAGGQVADIHEVALLLAVAVDLDLAARRQPPASAAG